jgi:hypothetical protein
VSAFAIERNSGIVSSGDKTCELTNAPLIEEHRRNPLTISAKGRRILSASQLPGFTLRPPQGARCINDLLTAAAEASETSSSQNPAWIEIVGVALIHLTEF